MARPLYTNASIQNLLGYTYANTLGETPSQENLDYWTNSLQSGDVAMEDFQNTFNDYSRSQNKTLLSDIALVNNVFEKGLGRSADAEEMDFWTNELTTGNVNTSNLVDSMASSYINTGEPIDVGKVKESVRDEYNSQMLGYDVTLADPFEFTPSDLTTDPSYQFRKQEGIDALDASAASRGSLLSGAQDKAVTEYGQNLASEEYSNAYNRSLSDYTTQQNAMLNMANLGTGATAATQTAGQNLGSTTTNALYNQGNAASTGITSGATSTNQALENALLALNL